MNNREEAARRAIPPGLFLARNSAFATVTVLTTAASMFVVYRLAAGLLGVRVLGLWSVTFGLLSVAGIADLGLPLVMVREIARLRATHEWQRAQRLVAFAATYTLLSTLLVTLLTQPLVRWIVDTAILKGHGQLPSRFALACAIAASLTAASATLTGVLEGLERYDLKFLTVLAGNVTLVGAAYLLLRRPTPEGVAWAFVAQATFVVLAGSVIVAIGLRRTADARARVPAFRSTLSDFRAAVRVGVPLRVAGLASYVFEPVTRFLIGVFGGAASAGIYEAASRLCIQANALISGGLQVIVPRLSALAAAKSRHLGRIVGSASRMTATGAVLGFSTLALAAPGVSLLLLSRLDPDFIGFAIVLGGAWMLHVLAAPTYFANIADGSVAWNWLSQWIAVGVNVLVGPLAGLLFGWRAVIAGPVAGLLAATVTAMLARHRRTHDAVLDIPRAHTSALLVIVCAAIGLQLSSNSWLEQPWALGIYCTSFVAFCVFAAFLVLRTARRLLERVQLEQLEGFSN